MQVCQINLVVSEAEVDSVRLSLGEPFIDIDKELTQYYITDNPPSPTLSQGNRGEVNMNIVFKRRLTSEAMMTFFPSLLLITISYATSFFKLPIFFNTAITVNVTVMLTTTTLLISVVKKLAPTSYIKWIEAWLIFAQLIPFTQIILITLVEWLKETSKIKEDEDEMKQEKIKEHPWLDGGTKNVTVTRGSADRSLISSKFINLNFLKKK